MVLDAKEGLLNQGRNVNEKGLPKENRKEKGAFKLTNTQGRNKKVKD